MRQRVPVREGTLEGVDLPLLGAPRWRLGAADLLHRPEQGQGTALAPDRVRAHARERRVPRRAHGRPDRDEAAARGAGVGACEALHPPTFDSRATDAVQEMRAEFGRAIEIKAAVSVETDLVALLSSTFSGRLFPDTAPAATAMPYATWQQVGGVAVNPWRGARVRRDAPAGQRLVEDARGGQFADAHGRDPAPSEPVCGSTHRRADRAVRRDHRRARRATRLQRLAFLLTA